MFSGPALECYISIFNKTDNDMRFETYVSVEDITCLSVGVRGIQGNVENLKQLATAAI